MIAIEIAVLVFLAVMIAMGIRTVAKPLTETYLERMKFKYRELGSQAERDLNQKVEVLEGEIMSLRQQVKSLQESVDFAIDATKKIEKKDS